MLTWWAFGKIPEELAFLCLEIDRICEQQLSHIVAIIDKEFANSLSDAIVKGLWPVCDHPCHCFPLLPL